MSIHSRTLDLLADLVAIDSQNPGLVPGGAGESAIAAHIEEWALARGLTVERLEVTPGRPSLIITAAGTGGGRRLMLCGHLDTVGIDEAGLEPRVDGDRMYGRGTYDMKAGLAAALIAVEEATRVELAGDVVVAAVADEEDASFGAEEMLRSVSADVAIVMEPTEEVIATAHRGFVWVEIEVEGIAAHGSRPELGVDAITKMAKVVTALDALNDELAERQHPLVGHSFLHASTITGGREASTIPDQCLLVVERRTIPGETPQTVMSEIEDLLARCRGEDPALEVSARTILERSPFEISPDEEIVQLLQEAGRSALDRKLGTGGASYWADSALIAEAGIPTVLFGPIGDGAHAAEEWVSITSAVDCALTLTEVARRFCASSHTGGET